jgi:hypothetical protein
MLGLGRPPACHPPERSVHPRSKRRGSDWVKPPRRVTVAAPALAGRVSYRLCALRDMSAMLTKAG